MTMESAVCYICCDRRRTADTDTSLSKIGIRHDSETLKEVLLRALSVGYVEDNPNEVETSKTSYSVCVISLNSQCDGHLQALCNRVADEAVIICKRCEKLLKDFEYHERTSVKIAKEIQSYLSRQSETQGNGISIPTPVSGSVITHKLDEKQSIQAAFKALRRSGLTSTKKRGRKRKSVETQPTDTDSVTKDDSDMEQEILTESDVQEQDAVSSSRMSKRIQRRREEGLVIRWGDTGYDEEIFTEGNMDSDANRYERRTDSSEKDRQLEFGGNITRDSLQLPFSDFDLEADSESSATEQSNIPERKKYNRKRNHRCNECAKLFPSQAHLKEHKVSHSNEQSFTCSICLKGFKRKNALNKHMRILHPNGAEKVLCTCGRIFASKELMYKHQAGSGSHRLLVCPVCGALYKTRQSLDSHMMLHKESKCYGKEDSWPFTCSLCNERFSSKASLSNHIASTHSNQDFKCTLCEKTCKTKQLLSQHLLRKHKLGSTEYPCPVCSKVFLIAKDLRRHVQSHNLGGSHECALCHAKFKSYPTLQAHMKIHSKDKPYDCVICLVPFASVEALKDHFNSHHGVKINDDNFVINWNRKCPLCSQVFMRRAGLAIHIKTHFDFEDTEILFVEDDEDEDIENTVAVFTEKSGSSEYPGKIQESSDLTVITEETNFNEYSGKIEENSTITVFRGQGNSSEYSRIIQDKPDFTCELQENTLNKNDYIKCDGEVRLLKEVDNVSAKGISVLINSLTKKSEVECVEVTCDKENTRKLLEHSSNNEEVRVPNKEIGGCHSKEEKLCSERVEETDSEGTKKHEDVNIDTLRNHTNEEEETKYICGQCSSVFLDMEDLQTHLLTCYQQDTDDDYVVVFEVDESNVN
ncbi:zinc finger protein 208-like [Penaeus chinensis]|uniref:zinc finger protein 208-like n=1 Tax=Penaeus chinensis TaxID=139456 RepID=UPI001FB83FA1|nr:zinc finger protein 208-like [Penaeus chinensis]